ncbi:glycosyltransferase family 2 protein [Ancylobacter sp. IITR112]|uniref:glycosyltransferase family 2 protein n=1 Tax=Ancylobacter sp. IITR112 TaxID=3138073 RepID=UPI00352AAE51
MSGAVQEPSVGIIIATLGRAPNVATLLDRLALQSRAPACVVLSMESAADAPPPRTYPFPLERLFGPRGSCRQRNRALDRLPPDLDIVLFLDDDYVPSCRLIDGVARFFAAYPAISGASGRLLADGIGGPGIAPATAVALVEAEDARQEPPRLSVSPPHKGLYGCNMAYRRAAIGTVRFDENLPLYGWQEDIDFGSRLQGPLVYTDAFYGVHCGEKAGRERNGRRLGYSQIANPWYLRRKGTMPPLFAYRLMLRSLLANTARLARPEPWIDRRGRLAGNWLALREIIAGRADPRRILEL